jgi:hypothetical protein
VTQPGWHSEVLAHIGEAEDPPPAADAPVAPEAPETPAGSALAATPPMVLPVVGRATVRPPTSTTGRDAAAPAPPPAPAAHMPPAAYPPPAPTAYAMPAVPAPHPAPAAHMPPAAYPPPAPAAYATPAAPVPAVPAPHAVAAAPVPAPPLPALPVPRSTAPVPAADSAVLGGLVGRQPSGDGMRSSIVRVARRALGATASAEAYEISNDLRQVVQPVTTCRRILVSGVRGGAGATTLAALLGLAYAGHRHERTLAMDVTSGNGSLSFRLGDAAVWSYHDVARLTQQPDLDQAARLVQSRGQLSLLPRPPAVDIDSYWTTSAVLTRFFSLAVVDGGYEALTAPGYLDRAHAHVLAIPATVDGVRTALAWMAAVGPEMWRRTVPVLVGHAPDSGLRLDATRRALDSAAAPATWLGYDRSLATGSALQPKRLSQQTIDTVLHIAGAALTRACGERL